MKGGEQEELGQEQEVFTLDVSGFELTEEQKFLFDLKGYLVIPNVFTEDEVAAMKEQVYKITHERESLPPTEITVPGGSSEILLTHPVVKGTLHDLIGPDVRLDNQFCIWRRHGQGNQAPHNGGPMRSPHFHYHFTGGRINSALTRMVVELNPVGINDGGTAFLAGSHKANYPIPQSFKELRQDLYEPYFERYEASPGSVVFFSENTCHVGPVWRNPHHPRVSIFLCFSEIGCRFHRHHNVPDEVIEGLSPEGRWYFRDIWPWDNNQPNGKYGGKNVLLVDRQGKITPSP